MKHLFLILFFPLVNPLMGSSLHEELDQNPPPALSSSSTSQESKVSLIEAIAQSTGNVEEFMKVHAPDFQSLSQDDLRDLLEKEAFKGALSHSTTVGSNYFTLKHLLEHKASKKAGTGLEIGGRYMLLPDLKKFSKKSELAIVNCSCLRVLPSCIGEFRALTNLDLSGNSYKFLPQSLEQLEVLKTLILNNNLLRAVPEVVGKLTSLTSLYLCSNLLKELPTWIGDLTNLDFITLTGNSELQGIPDSFTTLINLKTIGICEYIWKQESFKKAVRKLVENQKAANKRVVEVWYIIHRHKCNQYVEKYPLESFAAPVDADKV